MPTKEEEFLKRLLITFKAEAEEHISKMSSCLLSLQKGVSAETIELLYREFHSLKGASRSVGITEIEELCQAVEGLLHRIKKQELQFSPEMLEVISEVVSLIRQILANPDNAKLISTSKLIQTLSDLSKGLSPAAKTPSDIQTVPKVDQDVLPPKSTITEVKPLSPCQLVTPEYIKIDPAKLESIMSKVQDITTLSHSTSHLSKKAEELAFNFLQTSKVLKTHLKHRSALPADTYDEITSSLQRLTTKVMSLQRDLLGIHHSTSLKTEALIEDLRQIILTPFSIITSHMAMMVKDIARQQGKRVNCLISGDEIAIDKRILDEIKDPIIHILRNAVDHGIEHPELRTGKPPVGTIKIDIASLDSNTLTVSITDDGRGIKASTIKSIAVKKGILSAQVAETMSDKDAIELIFHSGFSTANDVTELSGRGLGMSIVKDKILKIGGKVEVFTEVGKMTTFKLTLPVSLAAYRAVVVEVSGRAFAIFTYHIQRVLRLKRSKVVVIKGRNAIKLDSKFYNIFSLASLLELPVSPKDSEFGYYVILNVDGKTLALEVDAIQQEQEMLLKPLGSHLLKVKNISGLVITGTADMILALNARDLITTACKLDAGILTEIPDETPESTSKSVLVVDDSITARTLFKNILENAGYNVSTAVDGIEAFTMLKTQHFDIVVSDVQMPRMDGFELVRKIRSDASLSWMPVALITGLESKEDKENGIEAGANAYIVKSSFDQSNLLNTVKRLIGT